MSQPNSGIFGADFFPTPRKIGRRMMAKIQNKDAKFFLEPSAGKGDLADVIRNPMTFEEYEEEVEGKPQEVKDRKYRVYRNRADHSPSVEIDVIEQHPGLAAVLRSKKYQVVGDDFLEYNGVSYYDVIIMNPPFSEGSRHLLKAWDFSHNTEIVCLLNAETIRNPHTARDASIRRLIADTGGEVEYLGTCFDTAERKTNVEVAMVYLKKTVPDDSADMWAKSATSERVYNIEVGDDPNMLAIRDNLGNMEHWYNMANELFIKGVEYLRRARLYMDQNKVRDSRSDRNLDIGAIAAMGLGNAHRARAEFLRLHRRLAWTGVFDQMDFHKWLDSKQQERFLRDVERDATIPFTADNIKSTLENVFLSRKRLFDESVANVFDELTSHAVENGSGPVAPAAARRRGEGWKTNDNYKVNERLVFPYGCRRVDYGSGFSMNHGDSDRIYTDLDRILCVLDAQPFDKCHTVGAALRTAFEPGHRYHSISDQVTESQYFEIRFFKKGTVHLKWKRLDLLESFNVHASRGKKWIGENTQQYRPVKRKNVNGQCERYCGPCQYKDGVCMHCEAPEIDPYDHIKCDLCREIAIATGEEHCPLHPISPQALPAQPAVMIQASETITSMGLFHEPGTCLSCGCLTDGQWCDACASLDLETEVL